MTVGVLVAFWVVAGVAVVLIAMAATKRRRHGSVSDRETRASARATVVGALALFLVLGVVVPAAIMFANSDADAEARGGVDLTDEQVEGRHLFARYCSQCHTLGSSAAVSQIGPNLDRMRPNEQLVLNAIEEGRARGMGQMPADIVNGPEAEAVASYVAAVAGR